MAVNSFAEDKLVTHLIWVCDPDTNCECELTCHETKGFWEHCACCFLNISCFCVQIDILSWVTQKSFWCSILVTLRCWLPKKTSKLMMIEFWIVFCADPKSAVFKALDLNFSNMSHLAVIPLQHSSKPKVSSYFLNLFVAFFNFRPKVFSTFISVCTWAVNCDSSLPVKHFVTIIIHVF